MVKLGKVIKSQCVEVMCEAKVYIMSRNLVLEEKT